MRIPMSAALAVALLAPLSGANATRALAAESPVGAPAGTSVFDTIRDRGFNAGFESRFFGPSLSSMSVYRPDPNTGIDNPVTPIKTENKFNLSYRISPALSAVATAEAIFFPAVTAGFEAKDPSFGLKATRILGNDNFFMDLGVRFAPGISVQSRSFNQWGAVRLEQFSKWDVPESRLSLLLVAIGQGNFLSATTSLSQDANFVFTPIADYRIGPKLRTTFSYKLIGFHMVGRPLFELGTLSALAGPGLAWEILPNLVFSPYVDFAVANRIGLDTTTLGAHLHWKMI